MSSFPYLSGGEQSVLNRLWSERNWQIVGSDADSFRNGCV
jgi:hypothetical protein